MRSELRCRTICRTAFAGVHKRQKSFVLLVEEGLFGSAAVLTRPS